MDREIKFRTFYDNRMHDNREAMRILYNNSSECWLTPKYPIMQYIGRKDNNKKEIFEADIILWGDGNRGDVYFENGKFKVRGFYVGWQDDPSDAFSENYPLEVIGNIYENNAAPK